MEIDSTRTGANAVGGNGVSGPEPELDRDAFMRLLVTQIRHQDPLAPMETQDMMNQLTQLSSVEHLIGIEERLATLQVGTASIANAQVADFVGKTVTADASTLRVEATGDTQGAFILDAPGSVTATIRDAEGNIVRELDLGPQGAGAGRYEWDGRNAEGVRVPPGRYTVELSATAADGGAVSARAEVTGTVSGISYANGYPELVVDGAKVLLGDVREVSDPPAPPAPPTSPRTLSSPEAAIASYTRPST